MSGKSPDQNSQPTGIAAAAGQKTTDERERLRILRSYNILDTPAEPIFDSLVHLTARLCGVPISTITLIDEDRQWFKAAKGLDVRESSRRSSFCSVAIEDRDPLVVPDTREDDRFRDHPLVKGPPHFRFYAGVPLLSPEGAALGTLCVMDHEPHPWSEAQRQDLVALAQHVMAHLELRRQDTSLRDLLWQHERDAEEMRRQAEHLSEAQRIAGVGSWEHYLDSDRVVWTPETYHILGVEQDGQEPDFHRFFEWIVAEDRPGFVAAHERAVSGREPMDVEYRMRRPDGEVRFLHARARLKGEAADGSLRLEGTVQDVTALRRAEQERQELLERERAARQAAQRAEAMFRAAFENMLAGIVMTAASGELISVNRRFAEMVGYTEEELREKSVRAITAPEEWENSRQLIERRVRGDIDHYVVEKRYVHKSGRRVPARTYVSSLPGEVSEGGTVALILDITDKTNALEALRRSQRLTEIAGRVARIGGWAIDLENQVLAWSDEVAVLHDHPPGFSPDLRAVLEYFAPEWRRVVEQAFDDCRTRGIPFDLEVEKITATGRRIWVRTIAEADRDASGRIVGVHGALQDVTEAHNARAALASMAEKHRVTLESITDAFVTIDHDWRFTYVNREAERLLRAFREELMGQSLRDKFPNFDGSPFDHAFQRAFDEGTAVHGEDYYPPLGRWFQLSAYPSHEGLAIYFQDVTARHEAQEKLEQALARTRRIFETSQDVIALVDREGRFVEVNSRSQPVWGWDPKDLIGRPVLLLIHPEDRGLVAPLWARTVVDEEGVSCQSRCLSQDGRTVHVHWSCVWSPQDQLYFVVARDVTKLVEAEERVRQSQRLEAVGQLTGGVAHDFNNLLSVVLGNSELLMEELRGQERLARLARMIRDSAQRGAELTGRLLSFSRRQTLAPSVLNVQRVIEHVYNLLLRTFSEAITVEVTCAPGIWPVLADAGQLESALLNLCLNARDALPDGGRIRVAASNTYLDQEDVRLHPEAEPGAYVLISVSDDGVGMVPEVLTQVFEPFFTTKPREKGTGLGLSMVYGFVRQSGGHIRIESTAGMGTEVKLYLPHASGEPAQDVPTVLQ